MSIKLGTEFYHRKLTRYSGFITPPRETLRPIFQLADLPTHESNQPLGLPPPPTPSLHETLPNSSLPTITPSSTL